MMPRSASAWILLLALSACAPPLGAVRVSVVFENESKTQCIKASARNAAGAQVNSSPAALPRAGKNTMLIGLSETPELTGELRITVARFSSADCSGTAFASETKVTSLVRGGATAMLEFRYTGESLDAGFDGGGDAGAVDAGTDAGCDTSACGNGPGICEQGAAIGCGTDGGCRFAFKPIQSNCSDGGVCNSMGSCIFDVCSLLSEGSGCDDQLTCTVNTTCMGGVCGGGCAIPPQCQALVRPISCVSTTVCATRANSDFGSCTSAAGGRCLDGGCLPWLALPAPLNLSSTIADLPYPTGSWVLASFDGGTCRTIIDTSNATASLASSDCGSLTLTSTVNDAGVMVITNLGLDVAPSAELHFIGSKPVQLIVIGNASIRGLVSVAPLLASQLPAGTNPIMCNASTGSATRQGGGGGGFGGTGGTGGQSGGSGGSAGGVVVPLRGGCPGAAGFKTGASIPGGTGGGAFQLIVSDTLTMVGGTVTAAGGGGTQGAADTEGGGGGGSGGTVIIEARIIDLTGGAVTANGGGGGEGGDTGQISAPGLPGPLRLLTSALAADAPASGGGAGGVGGNNSTPNATSGGNAGGSKGGGGGGGSAGVVYIRATSCTRGGSGIISGYTPMTISCT